MKAFSIPVGIREFSTFREFAENSAPDRDDLILTNEYIYRPAIEALGLPCRVLFQEHYGRGEPTDEMVDAILKDLGNTSFRRVIAVGGGTIIDIAKVIAVAAPGAVMDDLYGDMDAIRRHHGLIIIPTTCGTGSEVTNISVISRVRKGVKQGLVSPAMYADEAVLIREMLSTLPYSVFATSSIDAMIHAAESYLSPNACAMSTLFSENALRIIVSCWKKTVESGGGDAWKQYAGEFLRASNYAGIAFGYAGCAAVHALSYPVGSVYHVPHGQSNQMMFADVIRKYQEKKPVGKLGRMEELLAEILGTDPVFTMNRLYELMDTIYKKDRLRDHGVTEEDLPVFAKNVLETQQRLLKNNYTTLTYEDVLSVYRDAY